MNWDIIIDNWPRYLSGVGLTLTLAGTSLAISFCLALPLSLVRAGRGWASHAVGSYTLVLRGTPLLIQLFLVYYGLAQFDALRASPLWPWLSNASVCAIIALVLNSTAYTTEIFAGALRAIPHGEVEAGRAYGMSRWVLYRHVLLPRMLRLSLAQYGNEIILLLHATSLVSAITLLDITGVARFLTLRYYILFEPYIVAAGLYLALTMILVRLLRRLERRWQIDRG